jgi:hypothetical protein
MSPLRNQMSSNGFDERDVEDLLKGIPVTLGNGQVKVWPTETRCTALFF